MNQIVESHNPTMSSLELVAFINAERDDKQSKLRHDHFMAKVPKVLGDAAPDFLGTNEYVANGVTHQRRIYNFPKREACLMAMSYSYDLQAKVFDRMTELENQASQPFQLPQSMAEALRLAADQAEQIEQQQRAIEQAKPAVEYVERYVSADSGNKGFRQVAKLLKAKEPALRTFLRDRKIMYQLGGEWMPYQNHIDAGRFVVKTGVAENEHAYNTAKFTPKGVNWIAGLWAQAQLEVEA